jgi:choline dehydrogenase-like flavoprotein
MGTPTSPDEITQYNFIICGSGTSASDLARCLAETAGVRVLLLTGAESENHWVPASLAMNALATQDDNHAAAPSQSHSCRFAVQRVPRRITMGALGPN